MVDPCITIRMGISAERGGYSDKTWTLNLTSHIKLKFSLCSLGYYSVQEAREKWQKKNTQERVSILGGLRRRGRKKNRGCVLGC